MSKSKITIVKVQAAINRQGTVLIYDEKQTLLQETDAPGIWFEIMEAQRKGLIALPKVYCRAVITQKRIDLQGQSEDQNPGW